MIDTYSFKICFNVRGGMLNGLGGVVNDAQLKSLQRRNAERIKAAKALCHNRPIDLWTTDVSQHLKEFKMREILKDFDDPFERK